MRHASTGAGRPRRRWIERWLYLVGAGLIGYVILSRVDAAMFNARAKAVLAHMASDGAEARPSPKPGDLLGRIDIARIGVSAAIVEGVSSGDLSKAVGHIPGTALPGGNRNGNVALAGHRDTYFRGLRDIRTDDTVTVATPRGSFCYAVDSTWVVEPEEVDVLEPGKGPELTLVTCYPFHFIGHAPKRFVVRARQIGRDPAEESRAGKEKGRIHAGSGLSPTNAAASDTSP